MTYRIAAEQNKVREFVQKMEKSVQIIRGRGRLSRIIENKGTIRYWKTCPS